MQYFNVDIQIPMGGDLAWKAIIAEDSSTWFRFCFMVAIAKTAADYYPDQFNGHIVDIWGKPYTVDQLARLSPERGRKKSLRWHSSVASLSLHCQIRFDETVSSWQIVDWDRFWKKSKISSSDRVRAFRARQKSVACNALHSAVCNAHVDRDRDGDIDPPYPPEGEGGGSDVRPENKNESNSSPSEPPGAKRIQEILGIKPSKRELAQVKALLCTPTPNGWSEPGWTKAVIDELKRQLHLVKAELSDGKPLAAPASIAVARARTAINLTSKHTEEQAS